MDAGLKRELEEKVYAGQRLTRADGEALYACDDLAWLGELAHHVRTQKNGDRVLFNVNRHLNLRGFAEQVRDRLRPEIPLATTEEKRDAWVFYSGRFVEELDTRPRLLAYLAAGPRRDLLIEDEELREIRPALPEGTTEVLEGRVSGRPYHMLRLPPSAGAPTDPATTGAGR